MSSCDGSGSGCCYALRSLRLLLIVVLPIVATARGYGNRALAVLVVYEVLASSPTRRARNPQHVPTRQQPLIIAFEASSLPASHAYKQPE